MRLNQTTENTGVECYGKPLVFKSVVLNLFHCWDPLNATDVVWDPQVKIEKVCAPE